MDVVDVMKECAERGRDGGQRTAGGAEERFFLPS